MRSRSSSGIPGPVSATGDRHPVVACGLGADGEGAPVGHGLPGVAQEVQERPAQLPLVGEDEEPRGDLWDHGDARGARAPRR